MTQLLLVLAVALTVGVIVFGITVLIGGDDPGLRPVEPDSRSRPLPGDRPLAEADLGRLRFGTVLRGYRMSEVDAALRRAAYDIGYKDELINVLQAEVAALREGRFPDAEVLRRAREAAVVGTAAAEPTAGDPTEPVEQAAAAGEEEPAAVDTAPAEEAAPAAGEVPAQHDVTAEGGEADTEAAAEPEQELVEPTDPADGDPTATPAGAEPTADSAATGQR